MEQPNHLQALHLHRHCHLQYLRLHLHSQEERLEVEVVESRSWPVPLPLPLPTCEGEGHCRWCPHSSQVMTMRIPAPILHVIVLAAFQLYCESLEEVAAGAIDP